MSITIFLSEMAGSWFAIWYRKIVNLRLLGLNLLASSYHTQIYSVWEDWMTADHTLIKRDDFNSHEWRILETMTTNEDTIELN